MEQMPLFQKVAETAVKAGLPQRDVVHEVKRCYILELLKNEDFNQCRAAHRAGVHRNTLGRSIDELRIDVRAERRKWIAANGKKRAAGARMFRDGSTLTA